MECFRIGLVGCGGIARFHIEGYRRVLGEQGRVVAVCDPNRKNLDEFCDRHAVPARFTDPQHLIDSDEVDVISLLTPPAVRGEVIFPAVERGIHLLVEKPFGETAQDAAGFVEAGERAGTQIAVNHELRFTPEMSAIRQLIADGELGDIRFLAHHHFQNRTTVRGWRSQEKRLEINIFSIHLIDRIRWLSGRKPASVSAATRSWDKSVRGETFTALTVQFDGGAVGGMVSNWHSLGIPECRLRVDGTKGSAVAVKSSLIDDAAKLLIQQNGAPLEERDCSRRENFIIAMGESMAELLNAVRNGSPPLHSGRDNLETMAIVDAAYRSAEDGGALVNLT